MNVQLIHGDCLNELKNIEDNTVDLLLTDPPYGTNDKYGKNIKRGSAITNFSVMEWDRNLPLEYLNECFRIMKDDTWGVVFTDKKEITTIWNYVEKIGFSPRNTFYWIKTNKAPVPNSNFKSSVEVCIVFTKGKTNKKWQRGGTENNYFMSPFVLGKESVNHPTQKPESLMSYFINLLSAEGDVILDPFMGSGTTGVSSIKHGRRFIGIEIDSTYYKLSSDRINSASLYTENKKNSECIIDKFFE